MRDFLERFWSKATPKGECMEWVETSRTWNGYGKFHITIGGKTRTFRAHRIAWELANGQEIPAGMWALHRCDNPPCVNPEHLFLGTQEDNEQDKVSKGRWRLAK